MKNVLSEMAIVVKKQSNEELTEKVIKVNLMLDNLTEIKRDYQENCVVVYAKRRGTKE